MGILINVSRADEDEDDGYPEAMVAKAWCISAQCERFLSTRLSYLKCNFQSYEKHDCDAGMDN